MGDTRSDRIRRVMRTLAPWEMAEALVDEGDELHAALEVCEAAREVCDRTVPPSRLYDALRNLDAVRGGGDEG